MDDFFKLNIYLVQLRYFMGDKESKVQENTESKIQDTNNLKEQKQQSVNLSTLPSYKLNNQDIQDMKNHQSLNISIRKSMPQFQQFQLQPLVTITLNEDKKFVYFWLDKSVYNKENQQYLEYLKDKGIEIKVFASLPALEESMKILHPKRKLKIICAASLQEFQYQKLQKTPRISQVFLFCQNREKAKQLMMRFAIIKHPSFQIKQLKTAILQSQKFDNLMSIKTNLLFNMPQDINTLNKLRLNYYSFTLPFDREKAKADFLNFIKNLYSDQKIGIEEFQQSYKIDLGVSARIEQTLNWLSRDDFYWKSIQDLPQSSYLPQELAYGRLLFKDVQQAIWKIYKKTSRQQRQKVKEVYAVMELSKLQQQNLKKNQGNYLTFISFCKAFLSEKHAVSYFKRQRQNTFFRIRLPNKDVEDEIDSGYWIDYDEDHKIEKNVYFNIENFFKIEEVNDKQITLTYGGLADVVYKKNSGERKKQTLTQFDHNLIINNDFIIERKKQIHCQNDLLKIFDLEKSSSIQLKRTEILKKSNPSAQIMEIQKIEMAEFYYLNGEYLKAQKQLLSVIDPKAKRTANIHLAKLYFKTQEHQKFENIKEQLKQAANYFEEVNINKAIEAKYYIGFDLLVKGKYKSATKYFKDLLEFSSKNNVSVQSSTVGHKILSALSCCYSNSGRIQQSVRLLQSTRKWQQICEGVNSSSFLKTENQLLKKYEKKKDKQLFEESKKKCDTIIRQVDVGNHYYHEQSTIDLDRYSLEQSKIEIDESEILDVSEIKIEDVFVFEDY